MQAKKSLGQHFLRSQKAINTMVATSNIQKGDTVLEIGPGMGVLTEKLLETGAYVIAIEKDDSLIPILSEKFKKEISAGQLKLIHDDILNFDLVSNKVHQIWKSYKLVANIPYYITGQIIRLFLESDYQPTSMTLLVQKEVAERIVAKDKKESLLSLSIKAYGTARYVEKVLRGSFAPMPNVDSAIIYISNILKKRFEKIKEKKFFELLHTGFAHKRKQIFSNLSSIHGKEKTENALKKVGISRKERAENIPIEKWFLLCDIISQD